jgi:succinyl-diaminopimelate desuccinylase
MPATTSAGDPVALLKDLIRRRSITPADDGVLGVVEAALTPLGFAVTRLRFEGDGSYPVDNLFATRGSGGRHLLFCGHTDVVPPGDTSLWTHDPFGADEAGGKIFGRGAADMKSGVAAFVAAVAQAGDTAGRISIAITNDEEADSINGIDKLMKWAAGEGHRFDFAIVGEPSATTSVGDSIKIGRRGSLNGRITVTGVQGHVAYPDRAKNPLPVLAGAVTAIKAKPLDSGTDHFPPSNLEVTSIDTGNMATNVIPAAGVAKFNIRHNDRWSPATLEQYLRAQLASVDPQGCSIALEIVGRPSNVFLSPQGDAVERLCRTIEAVTGKRPELSTAGGTSDARFIAAYCPVVECGLPGPTMHKADEHIAVADLHDLTALYMRFIADYLG